jgi:isopenicillin N synthase-like dioxygenase
MAQAQRDGFFFVTRPPEMSMAAGDRFARSFYLPDNPAEHDPFRGFQRWTQQRLNPREGYFCRGEDQTEQFFLESRHWDTVFPAALADQARAMRDFSLGIVRAVLDELDLPEQLWDEATGRCLSRQGTYHLTFNHFRPEVRSRGLNIHKDSGWIAVVRSLEPGLEVDQIGGWQPIVPRPDAFIVNFGCAMEILTRESATPVAAVAHRVVEQTKGDGPDRFSYGLFVDSSLDTDISPGLFSYQPGHGLRLVTTFSDFLTEIVRKTYERDATGLY